ncbi:SDR family NAD(P)-dependent oxidoreductase [Novosphingobium aquimarinum]|uniref:SDR family NAD(P)-dependent oxidoreductase n=1 Tax=Novosphingobium aquimarinum TaxID=2682494 RepID=UPI0018DE1ECD|nr:SDR family NAD(P)-dependent oxidoreductase [Novosphingobium aquimarinum]
MAKPPRTALVTGASSGIGAAIARRLAAQNWSLALTGRNRDRLEAVARQCDALGAHRTALRCFDMREPAPLTALMDEIGVPDLYVSNHGVLDGRRAEAPVDSGAADRRVIEINLVSSVEALQLVLPRMQQRGSGQVVLVSSLAGLSPLPDAAAYSASKAGLIAYGLSLREALRSSGVGISVVCPGYVESPMADEHLGERPYQVDADTAARKILASAANNRRLTGFPAPLWPAALFSILSPERLNRFFTKGLRFTVAKRDEAD